FRANCLYRPAKLDARDDIELAFGQIVCRQRGLARMQRLGNRGGGVRVQVSASVGDAPRGTYLHADTAAAIAKTLHARKPTLPHHDLSERELDIFRRIALGRAIKEIGFDLGLSEKTVATYLARIREKTGLTSHVEIARYALKNG